MSFLARRLHRSALSSSASVSSSVCVASLSPLSILSRSYAVSASSAEESRKNPWVSYGLCWALAARGIIAKEKTFHNLKTSELLEKGARTTEDICGVPVYMRGNAVGGTFEISKAHFNKLLKQVSSHLSSISIIFVHDGAVGSFPKCDAKVRIISDSPSAALSLSNILWETPTRAISHDSCPLMVYVTTSISPSTGDIIGFKLQDRVGFIAADIEHSSLILCGKAFADINSVKSALAALASPVISARGGIPVSARILVSGDFMILIFALEDTIQKCSGLHEKLLSGDAGVVLSSHGAVPFFPTGDPAAQGMPKRPASVVLASADSSGVLPLLATLSPGQAAYHFLAGYQDGKFVPTYCEGPSPIPPLALAKALLSHLKENGMPSFLVNVSDGGKHIEANVLLKVVESTVSKNLPEGSFGLSSLARVGDLKGKYKSFLSGQFQRLPEEFLF